MLLPGQMRLMGGCLLHIARVAWGWSEVSGKERSLSTSWIWSEMSIAPALVGCVLGGVKQQDPSLSCLRRDVLACVTCPCLQG
ncbi:hypothetical protein V8C86DRAFT_2450961 [Haematococcus lacustris]